MKLVFLYGAPASGKLTVARELAALTGFALFHNHLVVDAVGAVFPFGSEPFVRLRESFWLTTFREAAQARQSFVFTFAPEGTVASDFPQRARQIVSGEGGELLFVRLTVPRDEQERRVVNADRGQFGKLRSLELLRSLRAEFETCEAAMPRPDLVLDTAAVAPLAAASRIVDAFGLGRAEPG
jgi:chloramphenicol 3-O-phosphotransferase